MFLRSIEAKTFYFKLEVMEMIKGLTVLAGVLTYFYIAYYSLIMVASDMIQMAA